MKIAIAAMALMILLVSSNDAVSQLHWGLRASLGASTITGYPRVQGHKLSVYPSPSGSLGAFGDMPLGRRTVLSAELSISQISSHYRMVGYGINTHLSPDPIHYVSHSYAYLTYLSLPLMVGVKSGKTTWKAGIQFSVALHRESRTTVSIPELAPKHDRDYPHQDYGVDVVDVGPRIGAERELTGRWSMDCVMYFGIPNLSKLHWRNFQLHVAQVAIGVKLRIQNHPGQPTHTRSQKK